jgi:alpha-mannosidase
MRSSAHIVTHTHWDREWYLPVERFRQRLVVLIDELIDKPPGDGESFLLDGQAIVIEDYLDVRPERRDDVQRLLRNRRLEAGPWYVLADELIPSGEALVRNLLTGRRVLRALETESPPVLYCPDSFGHPAALPVLARGFGLPLVMLWRGYGGARWPKGDTARWAAPGGDEVILFHLPRDGYEYGSHLPHDDAGARERWNRMRDELVPRSTTGVLLIPHGADHHARQPDHEQAVALLEAAGEADGVKRSSLGRFANELVARCVAVDLPRVRGELRDSYGYTWTLQGTFGTRAHEKRLNARTERVLLREAEPWSALAARIAGRSRRALVERAWRTLLAAHPHDTLCGCSVDAVAAAMELRLRGATAEGEGVRDDAIADLIGHDPVEARAHPSEWTPVVVLRNPSARARTGVAIVEIREFIAHAPVGPGSGASVSAAPPVDRKRIPRIGGVGTVQVLDRAIGNDRIESPRHYPDNDLVTVTTAAVWAADVPGYGIVCLPIGDASSDEREPAPRVDAKRARASANGPAAIEMRNDRLSVRVDTAGLVILEERSTGRRIDSLIGFRDEIDIGDLYTSAPRGPAATPSLRSVRLTQRGPLRAEITQHWRLAAGARTTRRDTADVRVRLILDAGAPVLRVEVDGENRASDHRLRIALATGVASPTVYADAAFGPVRRDPLVVPPSDTVAEVPPPTAPLHRYVSLFDATSGVTVYSDGLAEYETTDDGTVLATLVRAVGELSRNDLPERPGHAGWPVPTPQAQCLGPFEAAFAIMPHGPRDATIDDIEHTADDVLLPLTGSTLRSALVIPPPVVGAQLDGPGLAFSTLKESDDGQWLVARCVNATDEPASGAWTFGFPLTEAQLARLDETPMSPVSTRGSSVDFQCPPRGVVTLLVR